MPINGKQHYLWCAVDQDGENIDVYLQAWRTGAAIKRFFRRFIRTRKGEPGKIVADKLRSHPVACREVSAEPIHVTDHYADNRAERDRNLRVWALTEWSRPVC